MTKILFVCHGNICRSPMAEFMLKEMGKDLDIFVSSCATSAEEIGNDIHYGTKKILDKYHIPYQKRQAVQLTKKMYNEYDYIIVMDEMNEFNVLKIAGNTLKVSKIMSYAGMSRDVRDPWYTGNFEETYSDLFLGINGFISYLKEAK